MFDETNRPTLHTLLKLDAVTCFLMGLLLLLLADPITEFTRISPSVLTWAGLILLPVAVFMAAISRVAETPLWAAYLVVAGNAAWVILSVLLPASGMISPNELGWLFLIGQAAVVTLFAGLEWNSAQRLASLA